MFTALMRRLAFSAGLFVMMSTATLALANEKLEASLEQAQAAARQNPSKALAILERLIETEPGAQDAVERARLFSFRAELERDLGNLQQGQAAAEHAKTLADRSGNIAAQAEALRVLGTISAEQGDVNTALEHFHDAWRRLEGSEPSPTQLRLAIALGVGHQMIEDHARSLGYFETGLELAEALGRRHQEATLIGNIAVARGHLDGPKAALTLHQQALAIFKELGDESGIAYQLANLCDRLVELGRIEQGRAVCHDAAERLEVLGHVRVLSGVRGILGELHEQQGEFDEALEDYTLALEQAEGRIPTVERDMLQKLARLHSTRNEPEKALAVYRRYMDAREALWQERNEQTIAEMEVQYQLREREQELELANTRTELQAIELRQQNRLLITISIAFVLLAVCITLMLRSNRERGRLQEKLTERNGELEKAVEKIGQLANKDSLTQLNNRRSFTAIAEREIAQARRDQRPLCIFMVDIDHFKRLNDQHGHTVGDRVLTEIAAALQANLRDQDVLCRWGGEEFLALLSATELEAARAIADRSRRAIDELELSIDGNELHVTVTIGVVQFDNGLDLREAIDAADQAMYKGKRAGRNRVVVSERH